AAVVLDDLAAQHEADARAARLRREERHPQVLRAGEARAVVFDLGDEAAVLLVPAHSNGAAVARGLDRILDQVDHDLLDLIGVDRDAHGRSRVDGYTFALQRRRAAHDRRELDGLAGRRRQTREARVRTHEAAERL